MKAVLPAAGFGTRFLPITKAVPKEMLPLGAKPVIHHVVEEAVAAGFDEILIIISKGKEIIRQYFEPAPELERHLIAKGKSELAGELRQLHRMAGFRFCYQADMNGLGDAIRCAEDFVGNDNFAVLLADTVIDGPSPLPAMRACLEADGLSTVSLEPCPLEKLGRYGVAGGTETRSGVVRLDQMIEKPQPGKAPQVQLMDGSSAHFAFAARYLFANDILGFLRECQPGLHGEIQLTDAMRKLMETCGFIGIASPGKRLDIGGPEGLLAAQSALANLPAR